MGEVCPFYKEAGAVRLVGGQIGREKMGYFASLAGLFFR